jgi:GH24 family phage-related lysozyme (muramidase)
VAVIELGSSGVYVRVWQRIWGAKADGRFGANTDKASRVWQAARGVDPDGVVGDITRAALQPGDLIKPYEGLRLVTYDDHDGVVLKLVNKCWRRPDGANCLGYPTIGWGRRLWPSEWIESCTRQQADQWFDTSLQMTFMPAVRRHVGEDPARRCAAASFAYNCGTGALAKLSDAGFVQDWWSTHYTTSKGVQDARLQMRRAEEAALYWG